MSAELERTTVISDVDDDSVENKGNDLNFKLKCILSNLFLKGKAKTRTFHFSLEGKLGPSTFPQHISTLTYAYDSRGKGK